MGPSGAILFSNRSKQILILSVEEARLASTSLFCPLIRMPLAETFLVDKYIISISKPESNSLGNKYDYSKTYINDLLVEESTTHLFSLKLSEVDITKIPEDY